MINHEHQTLTWPRLTPGQLEEFIRAELPGMDFRIQQSDQTDVVTLEWQRRVEGYRAAISDREVVGSPDALSAVTLAAIDAYREKAMQDYGLRAILDREKVEAHRVGFNAMVKNLEGYVAQNMTEWIEVLDEDGVPEVVRGGPTYEGARLLAWAKALTSQ